MKAAILSHAEVPLVDITHDLPPGDIWGGAWTLKRIWTRFPSGTVHLCVVDPTVGSDRRAVAARAAERWFVGPDNGLPTFLDHIPGDAIPLARAWTLRAPPRGLSPSATFHGRDLFAPAAAALATGDEGHALDEEIAVDGLVRLEVAPPAREEGRLEGRVVHVDRFGNLVTDLPVAWLGPDPRVRVGSTTLRGLVSSYADAAPGEPLLTRGSAGTLEISVRDGRADRTLGASRGDEVSVAV